MSTSPDPSHVRITYLDDGTAVAVPRGSRLIDVCETHDFTLPFGCCEGGCGTCLIEVKSGLTQLAPPDPMELETCEALADGNPRARLACQCVVLGDIRFCAFPL